MATCNEMQRRQKSGKTNDTTRCTATDVGTLELLTPADGVCTDSKQVTNRGNVCNGYSVC